jgi:uncharacterized protein (TIGR02145 family)
MYNKHMQKTLTKTLILAVVLTAALGVNYLFAAWTGPTQDPTDGNTDTPVHIGTTDQVKDGGLSLDALSVFGGGYFQGDVGIGVVTPTETLEVSGDIKATEAIKVGNTIDTDAGAIRWTGIDFEGYTGTEWVSFTATSVDTFVCGLNKVQDTDGNLYDTVSIGTQCWITENLNVGTMINGTTEQTDNAVIEKYCYSDSASNCSTYGGLYQWDEVMQFSTTAGAQGICPANWHVPTDDEWQTMEIYLGMSESDANAGGWRGINEGIGTKLKQGGSSDFEGKLGGYWRVTNDDYQQGFTTGWFWLSSPAESNATPIYVGIRDTSTGVHRSGQATRPHGFSVRCLKD